MKEHKIPETIDGIYKGVSQRIHQIAVTIQGEDAILRYLETKHFIVISKRTFKRYRERCPLKCFNITSRLMTTEEAIDKWVEKLKNCRKRTILSDAK